jgi:hypothetical protein
MFFITTPESSVSLGHVEQIAIFNIPPQHGARFPEFGQVFKVLYLNFLRASRALKQVLFGGGQDTL